MFLLNVGDEFQEVIGEVVSYTLLCGILFINIKISCQTEGMCQQLSSNEYHRKERFPSEYYPEVNSANIIIYRKSLLFTCIITCLVVIITYSYM